MLERRSELPAAPPTSIDGANRRTWLTRPLQTDPRRSLCDKPETP